jgi:hypothetical protein
LPESISFKIFTKDDFLEPENLQYAYIWYMTSLIAGTCLHTAYSFEDEFKLVYKYSDDKVKQVSNRITNLINAEIQNYISGDVYRLRDCQ